MAASKSENKTTKGKASQKSSRVRKRTTGGSTKLNKRIGALLARVETQFDEGSVRASLADYIRLLQMQRECEEQEPRNVEVKWIDSSEADQSNG